MMHSELCYADVSAFFARRINTTIFLGYSWWVFCLLWFFVKVVSMLFLIVSYLCIRMVKMHAEIWKESSLRWIEGMSRDLIIRILHLMIEMHFLLVGFISFYVIQSKIWLMNFVNCFVVSKTEITHCTLRKLHFSSILEFKYTNYAYKKLKNPCK
jgi:hypothetical protein